MEEGPSSKCGDGAASQVADVLNVSVDSFVRDLTRRACQAAEASRGKSKRKTSSIEHEHILTALGGIGAGHLCCDVQQVAECEEKADKANVRLI